MAHDQVKAWEIESLVDAVEDTRLEQWRAHGQQLINDARKVCAESYILYYIQHNIQLSYLSSLYVLLLTSVILRITPPPFFP